MLKVINGGKIKGFSFWKICDVYNNLVFVLVTLGRLKKSPCILYKAEVNSQLCTWLVLRWYRIFKRVNLDINTAIRWRLLYLCKDILVTIFYFFILLNPGDIATWPTFWIRAWFINWVQRYRIGRLSQPFFWKTSSFLPECSNHVGTTF